MVRQLITLQLQIHPYKFQIGRQGPLSDPFTPRIDIFQGITLVFRETIYERNQTKYNDIVAKLQDVKLQIQTIFSKTSKYRTPLQCLCDMNPDLDPIQAIAPVFSKTSKFFTPLPTSRKIDFCSNLSFDPSSDLASRKIVVLSDLDSDPSAGLDWNLIPESLDQVESQIDLIKGIWNQYVAIPVFVPRTTVDCSIFVLLQLFQNHAKNY